MFVYVSYQKLLAADNILCSLKHTYRRGSPPALGNCALCLGATLSKQLNRILEFSKYVELYMCRTA